jgi:hypothetical protein
MTLAVPISPQAEAKLRERAAAAGQPLDVYAARVLEAAAVNPPTGGEDATIALLRSWNEEDATDDPAELAARQREWDEFAASINAHHSSNRKVYP